MRKIIFYLLLLFTFSFLIFTDSRAYDYSDTGWTIAQFNSSAKIDTSQKVTVTEEITANFGTLSKHGIYRYIPYKYSRSGNNYNVRIKINSIIDDHGNSIQFNETRSGDNLTLKIGDPDQTVTGAQKYIINYEVERVINSFSDHDEFYWNVTGNDWPVPLENVKFNLSWPDNAVSTANVCYIGLYGSQDQNCQVDIDKNNISFTANQSINPGEAFTIVSGIKPGVLRPYSTWQIFSWFISDNWAYLIPLFVLFWLVYNYWKNGRDPRGRTTIAPEFAPPDNLRPAVLGTVYDEKVDAKDISAIIIDLAVRGYLKIKETKSKGVFGIESTDYEFVSTGKDQKNLAYYEKEILHGIFENDDTATLSDLKEEFYKRVKNIKDDLYKNVVKDGYFLKNPESIRNIYVGIGMTLVFLGIFFVVGTKIFGTQYLVVLIVSGIFIIIFSFAMPKRTDKGVETTRQIKGFRLYMHTAERYRERFNEKEKIFEKFLPYAMVFGIVKEWANAFKDMQMERPDWYIGTGVFYPWIFADNMIAMQNTMNSTLIAPPSQAGAGGSGFGGGGVGGGFGGGGGGSW